MFDVGRIKLFKELEGKEVHGAKRVFDWTDLFFRACFPTIMARPFFLWPGHNTFSETAGLIP
jgi:hypothetical protein